MRIAALLFVSISPLLGQMPTAHGDEYEVQILPGPNQIAFGHDSSLNLGAVSRDRAERKQRTSSAAGTFSVIRNVRLKVLQNNRSSRPVVVEAFLIHDCYPCHLKFDGIELGATPKIVMRTMELNTATEHRIELEIPLSMPAGLVDAQIGWQVEQQ